MDEGGTAAEVARRYLMDTSSVLALSTGALREIEAITALAPPIKQRAKPAACSVFVRESTATGAVVAYELDCVLGAQTMKTAGQLVLRLVAGELLVEDVVNEQGSVLEHLFRLEPEAAEGVRIEAFLWTRTEGGVLAVAVQNTGEGRIDVRLRLGHSNLRRRVRLEEGERRAQVVLVSILSWFKHLTVSIERGDEEVRIRVPFPSAALRQLPPPKRSQRLLVRLRYVAVVIATVGPLVALSAHRLDLAAVILIAAIGFAEFPRLRVLLARLSRTAPS